MGSSILVGIAGALFLGAGVYAIPEGKEVPLIVAYFALGVANMSFALL